MNASRALSQPPARLSERLATALRPNAKLLSLLAFVALWQVGSTLN
ncbi:MAG: hypothetical protein QOH08_376, partial [Chloroflexota bacterium]|nr:hypothetical protein [Chloroflexota bacterium]